MNWLKFSSCCPLVSFLKPPLRTTVVNGPKKKKIVQLIYINLLIINKVNKSIKNIILNIKIIYTNVHIYAYGWIMYIYIDKLIIIYIYMITLSYSLKPLTC